MSGGHDVAVVAAGASGNDALLDVEFAVGNLIHQAVMEVGIAHAAVDAFFRFMKDISQIGVELVDGKGVARMHGHGDHRLDFAQIDVNDAVVVSDVGRIEFLVILRPAVLGQVSLRIVVGAPYRRQARRFRRHDVDAVAVIRIHRRHAGADEFHDFVLYISILKDGADDGDSDVVGADGRAGLARQVYGYDARIGDVVRIAQELLDQLAAAFADGHRTQGAVPRVAVRADDHLAAAGHLFPHVLVDDGDVRRYEDAAVFLSCRQSEYVVVFVDRAADGAQRIVAVRQHVRQRKRFHT